MSKDAEVVRIAEVRGKDGATAYEVHGGKHGEGETSYYISRETMRDLERQGKQALKETLQRCLETSLQGRKEL